VILACCSHSVVILTFIMLYLYHDMEVNNLVVDEMININIDSSQLHV
jgi:hypothetical protein